MPASLLFVSFDAASGPARAAELGCSFLAGVNMPGVYASAGAVAPCVVVDDTIMLGQASGLAILEEPTQAASVSAAASQMAAGEQALQQTAVQAAGNADQIRQAARNALLNNRTYLGVASPTLAQTSAQVSALTRQMNGVIRLVIGQLDGTN